MIKGIEGLADPASIPFQHGFSSFAPVGESPAGIDVGIQDRQAKSCEVLANAAFATGDATG